MTQQQKLIAMVVVFLAACGVIVARPQLADAVLRGLGATEAAIAAQETAPDPVAPAALDGGQ